MRGYELHLIFLGLNSLEESIQRVAYRVRFGGHKVAEESIRYNYEYGYKNLYKYFKEFNSVTLFNNAIANTDEAIIPKEILHIVGNVVYIQSEIIPQWAQPLINEFNSSGIIKKCLISAPLNINLIPALYPNRQQMVN